MTKDAYKAIGAMSIIVPISLTVAAAVAVAGCAFYLISQIGYTRHPVVQKPGSMSVLAIRHVDPNAFGSLANEAAGGVASQANERSSVSAPTAAPMMASAVGQGAGGVMMNAAAVGSAPSVGVAADATSPSPAPDVKMMPPIRQTTIEYAYTGDPVTLSDTSLDVMKYMPSPFSTSAVNQALAGLNLGVMNLGSFSNLGVTDFSLTQDVPFGYQLSVSPKNGIISIDQNWMQWQSAYPNCQDEACVKTTQLKQSDVPSNEELVKIADDFLAAHNIDRSAYGSGVVDESWKTIYPMRAQPMVDIAVKDVPPSQGTELYIPDTMQVTYSLLMNKSEVYANGGGSHVGLTVTVNIRVKKVASVYNLRTLNFDASAYDAETDWNAILESAKKGGINPIWWGGYADGSNAQKVTVNLGTPTRALVQYYTYDNNQSNELYIPALIFPVEQSASDTAAGNMTYGFPKQVIVPLVKGLPSQGGTVTPYMMGAGSTGSSSGGSSVSGSEGTVVAPPTPAVTPLQR
jgi:hypothetical protein